MTYTPRNLLQAVHSVVFTLVYYDFTGLLCCCSTQCFQENTPRAIFPHSPSPVSPYVFPTIHQTHPSSLLANIKQHSRTLPQHHPGRSVEESWEWRALDVTPPNALTLHGAWERMTRAVCHNTRYNWVSISSQSLCDTLPLLVRRVSRYIYNRTLTVITVTLL